MEGEDDIPSVKKGTVGDRQAMWRMGKVQELRRNFRFVSMFGFSVILLGTWEWSLSTSSLGLIDGGKAGLIWMFLIAFIGYIAVYLSMAEMGSMAPTSGGQYHWVSEFAPAEYQKPLSYMIGWLSMLGWQTGCATGCFVAGTQIQGLIALNKLDYSFEAWHGTLLAIAIAVLNVVFNIWLAKKLPLIESIVIVVHVFGFFAIVTVLWTMGPVENAHDVFTTFNDGGGWGNMGLATLAGMVGSAIPMLGGDCIVHMSEELRDASKNLPRAMMWSTIVNGVMGWVMLITFCSVIGDVETALATPTKQPFLFVFYQATNSRAATTVLGSLVLVMIIFSVLSVMATCSRQLFAFSRDQGMPFGKTLSYVPPGWDIPINAVLFTFTVAALLSLINLGSAVALNNIGSLNTAANIVSYFVSIGCVAWRRIKGEPLLPSHFMLGRFGLFTNIVALVFLTVVFVFSFFPVGPKPTPDQMNWAILMFGGTVGFASVFYYYRGRHVYVGPVAYVRKSA
ncbi:amino acid/polyamine transporter I [Clohesyomyces aquaticus]|uniref:Amino acid/polyamine transporter I n=1 Tax=Clohesyomyces aquaticus TaxID=1231657 RepID=A0A1Y1ZXP6_9PLEO|nr:amino acid/polyamine transporter I [Clohesyomyces aquaticus]